MYYTEKYAEGKYDVILSDEGKLNPRRVGHVTGAKTTWLAEQGPTNLGFFKTKKAAVEAIAAEVDRMVETIEQINHRPEKLSPEYFKDLPKGTLLHLSYDAVNRGDFWWWHSHTGEREGNLRVFGGFKYEGDEWMGVDDYLYEFCGDICRGSGAEPVMLVEQVSPDKRPERAMEILRGVPPILGEMREFVSALAKKHQIPVQSSKASEFLEWITREAGEFTAVEWVEEEARVWFTEDAINRGVKEYGHGFTGIAGINGIYQSMLEHVDGPDDDEEDGDRMRTL